MPTHLPFSRPLRANATQLFQLHRLQPAHLVVLHNMASVPPPKEFIDAVIKRWEKDELRDQVKPGEQIPQQTLNKALEKMRVIEYRFRLPPNAIDRAAQSVPRPGIDGQDGVAEREPDEILLADRVHIMDEAYIRGIHTLVQCFPGSTVKTFTMFPEELGDVFGDYDRTEQDSPGSVAPTGTFILRVIGKRNVTVAGVNCVKTKLRVSRLSFNKTNHYILKHLAFSEWPMIPKDAEGSEVRMKAYVAAIRQSKAHLPNTPIKCATWQLPTSAHA